MSGSLSPRSLAATGLRGIFGSWLRRWSGNLQRPPAHRSIEASGPSPQPSAALRVLVVDDNPVNLMLVSALMASRSMVPVLASDGGEAVALACEGPFDLILMDLQMPGLGGLEATAAIRRFEASASRPAVPVVAYSSSSPAADVLASHGINGSLPKPCDDRALEDCLLRWCPGYRSSPAADGVSSGATPLQAAGRRLAR